MSIDTLKPLFHILGFASKNISKLNEFLFSQTSIPSDKFPIQATIPLFYTIKAKICFKAYSECKEEQSFFSIDEQVRANSKRLTEVNVQEVNYDLLLSKHNVQYEQPRDSLTSEQAYQMFNDIRESFLLSEISQTDSADFNETSAIWRSSAIG